MLELGQARREAVQQELERLGGQTDAALGCSPLLRPTRRSRLAAEQALVVVAQARSNVGKRLEFIRRELERLEGQATSLGEKQARKQQQVGTQF